MVIRKRKNKRSEDQKNRLWGYLYPSVGNHLGYSSDDIHQLMGFKFLKEEKAINGENVSIIQSTSRLNVKQMVDYQRNIEIWAMDLGWSSDV